MRYYSKRATASPSPSLVLGERSELPLLVREDCGPRGWRSASLQPAEAELGGYGLKAAARLLPASRPAVCSEGISQWASGSVRLHHVGRPQASLIH